MASLIFLNVNISWNQTLWYSCFMVYVKNLDWMAQLILVISLWKTYLPLIQKDSLIHMHGLAVYKISQKLWGYLFVFSTGFTSFGVLLFCYLLITILIFVQFLMVLYLTLYMIFFQSTHQPIYLSLETLMPTIRTS